MVGVHKATVLIKSDVTRFKDLAPDGVPCLVSLTILRVAEEGASDHARVEVFVASGFFNVEEHNGAEHVEVVRSGREAVMALGGGDRNAGARRPVVDRNGRLIESLTPKFIKHATLCHQWANPFDDRAIEGLCHPVLCGGMRRGRQVDDAELGEEFQGGLGHQLAVVRPNVCHRKSSARRRNPCPPERTPQSISFQRGSAERWAAEVDRDVAALARLGGIRGDREGQTGVAAQLARFARRGACTSVVVMPLRRAMLLWPK
ncbi:hypothetical protein BDK51DRAFT_40874 [Blyttiomyces helicus]|uniref:Uncharacterized protein n=1 Tax=Blyttiomyces helicus TaxID=388810 RepID=A0A4P9W1M3_9FUNG|nr:hypothetical protein BDK51DRAFT_40874 [Blyttiomyces helicus]|eukprot:RKO86089.1 hypothetical protein BDK51DRAFT_40874 [Blyttiomyces helicus]